MGTTINTNSIAAGLALLIGSAEPAAAKDSYSITPAPATPIVRSVVDLSSNRMPPAEAPAPAAPAPAAPATAPSAVTIPSPVSDPAPLAAMTPAQSASALFAKQRGLQETLKQLWHTPTNQRDRFNGEINDFLKELRAASPETKKLLRETAVGEHAGVTEPKTPFVTYGWEVVPRSKELSAYNIRLMVCAALCGDGARDAAIELLRDVVYKDRGLNIGTLGHKIREYCTRYGVSGQEIKEAYNLLRHTVRAGDEKKWAVVDPAEQLQGALWKKSPLVREATWK